MATAAKTIAGNRSDYRSLPAATYKKSRLTWLLWLIPAGALLVCGWFLYRDYVASGPLITIYFESAEGVEPGNTQVNYRGANIGQVKSVTLAPDGKSVIVKARLVGAARSIARQGTVFWIVRPELKVGAISGLRTIISGDYIAVQPGSGAKTNRFAGAERAPFANEPNALHLKFLTDRLHSLQEQSPIFYRGIQVGEVVYYQLTGNGEQVLVHANIWEQYAPLVRKDTKFWNAGGLDLRLGLFKGVQVSAVSPRTILSGGIEFATPTEFQDRATNETTFLLAERADDKWKTWAPDIPLQLPPEAIQTNSIRPSVLQ